MKNTINLILRYVQSRIPEEILIEAFQPNKVHRSLDVLIKELVILDYVLPQCNIFAGRPKKIRLITSYIMNVDDLDTGTFLPGNYSIYKIPPEARENRPINAVLDLSYPANLQFAFGVGNDGGMVTGRSVSNSASELLSSVTRVPSYIAPSPVLIDGHAGIIRVEPPSNLFSEWILSCVLEYDKNFSNISPNMIPSLQKMTLLATKSYIFNALVVKLSHGRLVAGSQLEAISNVVDKYEEAEEQFQEALLKFRGAATFSPENLANLVSMMF